MTENMPTTDTKYRLSPINLENPSNAHDFLILLTGINKKVLELGPASGYLSKILKDRDCHVTGIEIDPVLAEQAEQFLDKIIVGDIEELDLHKLLGSKRYDVILIGDVLEHLKNPKKVLEKLHDFLNDNGCLVCSIPNIAHGSIRLKLLNGEFRYKSTGLLDETHLHFFTLDSILSMFHSSGYSITELRRVTVDIFGGDGADLKPYIIPGELIQSILMDPEATVFQYVFRAITTQNGKHELNWLDNFSKDITTEQLRNKIEYHKTLIEQLQSINLEHQKTIQENVNKINRLAQDVETLQKINLDNQNKIQESSELITEFSKEVYALQKINLEQNSLVEKLQKINLDNQNKIQESSELITEFSKEVYALQKINLDNQNKIQESSELITEFSKEVYALQKINLEQNSLVEKLQSKIIIDEITLAERESRITNLQVAIVNYQNIITDIHQSFVLRMLHQYDKTIGKFIPLKPKKYTKSNKVQSTQEEHLANTQKATQDTKLYKKDIICFPIINWDYRFQRPQHIMTEFVKNGHRIFYLTVNLRKLDKPYEIKQLSENIFQIEFNSPKFFDIYKDIFDESLISKVLESFQIFSNELKLDAVCFVEFPTWTPLVLELKKQFNCGIIFDCLDDFTGFSNVIKEREKEEKTLVKNSDLVIATASYLLKKVMKETSKTLFLPNACEFSHFNRISSDRPLRDYKKPIIGFFGSIADWFDNNLIEFVAEKRPNLTFVFIGHTFGSDIRKLQQLKNVHFLGERPYSELPNYLHEFDVCLIPFKVTPLIIATHPVKIYEYLAAGKAVVTTDIPELLPMDNLCYIAKNKQDFLVKIDLALKENDENLVQRRMDFASKNTWEQRFSDLYSVLNKIPSLDILHHN